MTVRSGLEFYILKFTDPLHRPANLLGHFSLAGQIFLYWAAATLKGLGECQNKKSRPLFTVIFKQNGNFKT